MTKSAAKEETTTTRDDPMEYRHDGKCHIAESGRVALSNWVGRVGSKRVRVYRGASEAKVPEPVRAAMKASGVGFGVVTLAELGLKALPPTALRAQPAEG